MRYVVPKPIELLSSNIPLSDYPEYSPVATYNTGVKVTVAEDLKNYKCAADGTIGVEPKTDASIWMPSTINRMAMFDLGTSRSTEHADSIEFTYLNAISDTLAFIGLEANSITIELFDADGITPVVDAVTYPLVAEEKCTFANYLLKERRYAKKKIVSIPKVFNAVVKVTIEKTGSIAKCRYCFPGIQEPLGLALWDGGELGLDIVGDQSRDAWGDLQLDENMATFDVLSISVMEDFKNIDLVKEDLRDIVGKAVLFIAGSTKINSLNIFGIYRGFRAPINPRKTIYKLNLESLAWNK
jgi:hypothetical protein